MNDERYTFTMTLRGYDGKIRATAVATDVRATKTMFVVDRLNTRVIEGVFPHLAGKPAFTFERRYRRDTFVAIPRPTPFSGNGAWTIDPGTVMKMADIPDVEPHCGGHQQFDYDRILAAASNPVDMLLFCPRCNTQHIDAPEEIAMSNGEWASEQRGPWTNPPHRSHLCHACGHVWRPADVATNGVAAIKTKGSCDGNASPPPLPAPQKCIKVRDAIFGVVSVTKVFPGDVIAEEFQIPSDRGDTENTDDR